MDGMNNDGNILNTPLTDTNAAEEGRANPEKLALKLTSRSSLKIRLQNENQIQLTLTGTPVITLDENDYLRLNIEGKYKLIRRINNSQTTLSGEYSARLNQQAQSDERQLITNHEHQFIQALTLLDYQAIELNNLLNINLVKNKDREILEEKCVFTIDKQLQLTLNNGRKLDISGACQLTLVNGQLDNRHKPVVLTHDVRADIKRRAYSAAGKNFFFWAQNIMALGTLAVAIAKPLTEEAESLPAIETTLYAISLLFGARSHYSTIENMQILNNFYDSDKLARSSPGLYRGVFTKSAVIFLIGLAGAISIHYITQATTALLVSIISPAVTSLLNSIRSLSLEEEFALYEDTMLEDFEGDDVNFGYQKGDITKYQHLKRGFIDCNPLSFCRFFRKTYSKQEIEDINKAHKPAQRLPNKFAQPSNLG